MKMKYIVTSFLFSILIQTLPAQNFCSTGGAQGGTLGVSDCYPYNSPCPEESNAEILLILDTDMFAAETSWQVQDLTDVIMVAEESVFANDSTYHFVFCAEKEHCYHFAILDSAGNGIDPANGSYSLYWNGDLIKSGANFGSIDSISFGACCDNFSAVLLGGIPCVSYSEGQVTVETTGGTAPFEYLWSNGASFTEEQSVTPGDGQISITVTDASNCVAVDTFQTADLQPLEFILETSSGSSCIENSGMASVSILSGIPPFKFTWSNGDTEPTQRNLPPGTYSITVTDASNCVSSDSAVIIQQPALQAQTTITDVRCSGDSTGSINLSVSGGTQPYSYLWSNGATTKDLSNLGGSDYSVTVTDANQCLIDLNASVGEPDSLIIEVDSVFSETNNDKDGAILITVSGGTGPTYNFKWYLDFNLISEEEDPTGLSTGEYTLILTDSNGCPATITVDVNSTGVNYPELIKSISLIPNPTLGKILLQMDFRKNNKVEIAIINNLGEAIITTTPKEVQSGHLEFDLSHFSPGLYLVKITIDGRVVTKRLILSK